jgi:hypothetical protein
MRPEDQEAINADVGRRNTARKAYTREGSTAPNNLLGHGAIHPSQ